MSVPSLATVIAKHRYREQDHCTITGTAYCWCGWSTKIVNTHKTAITLHAEHVEAESRAAQTVRTVDELNALPTTSVVRDASGAVFEYAPDGEGDVVWWYDGDPEDASDVELPALVLHLPADGAEDQQ